MRNCKHREKKKNDKAKGRCSHHSEQASLIFRNQNRMLKVGKVALDVSLVSMAHLDKHMKMKKCEKKKNSAMSWLERQADQLKKKKEKNVTMTRRNKLK